jgi:hypothetical protein
MANNIYLGPTGNLSTLPQVNWIGTSPPGMPVVPHKQIEEAKMADGSSRFAFYKKKRTFQLEWGALSKNQVNTIEGLYDENQTLVYRNEYDENANYSVVFTEFEYELLKPSYPAENLFRCRIVLQEA